jgi:hypothetical protein
MEKEFIPYEQALELKELGFDEPCFAWYVSESYGLEYGEVIKSDLIRDGIVAPTYSQAFRWLLALANKDEHFSNKWTISYNEDYYSLFLGGCNMGVFEAELECLKKLIEIVKEKS